MSRALRLEPLEESDLGWVVEHERALHSHPWTLGNFRDSLSSGHSCWRLCELGAVVGYLVVMTILDEAHLLNISVVRAEQGKGLGGAALGLLFEHLRPLGIQHVLLEVRPSNAAARALYAKTGFEQIGRRKGYYPAPDGREDAIVMRRAL